MDTRNCDALVSISAVFLLAWNMHAPCLAQVKSSADSKNPFSKDASLSAKIRLIDKASPSLSWYSRLKVANEGTSYMYKESFARSHGLSVGTVAALDASHTRRLDAHAKNFKDIRLFERQEFYNDPSRNVRNLKPLVGEAAIGPVPEAKVLNELLSTYEAAELKAEQKLAEELDEILTPDQFESLAIEYMDLDTLYIPIVAKYLGLADDQLEKIKAACFARMKFNSEVQAGPRRSLPGMGGTRAKAIDPNDKKQLLTRRSGRL